MAIVSLQNWSTASQDRQRSCGPTVLHLWACQIRITGICFALARIHQKLSVAAQFVSERTSKQSLQKNQWPEDQFLVVLFSRTSSMQKSLEILRFSGTLPKRFARSRTWNPDSSPRNNTHGMILCVESAMFRASWRNFESVPFQLPRVSTRSVRESGKDLRRGYRSASKFPLHFVSFLVFSFFRFCWKELLCFDAVFCNFWCFFQ